MTNLEIITYLEKTKSNIKALRLPQRSGIYAIYLYFGSEIKLLNIKGGSLLYVGSTNNLAERVHEIHFNPDSTGFSTVRRTFGALLKKDLDLKAVPRSSGPSGSNINNYKFFQEGEKRLTHWMVTNLEVGTCPVFEGYEELEKKLIKELCPPLSLKGWKNPLKNKIMELRKECAAEALKNAG
jgi:hypothetical protein